MLLYDVCGGIYSLFTLTLLIVRLRLEHFDAEHHSGRTSCSPGKNYCSLLHTACIKMIGVRAFFCVRAARVDPIQT